MRLFIESQGNNTSVFSGDVTTTGNIIIPVTPYNPNDLVNKNYIDTIMTNINGSLSSHVNNQVIHLTQQQNTFLNNISVPAGVINYTSGLSSNLRGGIESKLSRSGGTLSGPLYQPGTPTSANQLATKEYVDNSVASTGVGSLNTGTICFYPSNSVPDGYLLCNGALVSKTTYSNLYTAIGDIFAYLSQPGSGKPWKQQYYINSTQSGDITGWTTGTSLPATVGYSQAVVTKNYVYLLGGNNGSWSSTVYLAPINSDGTLGTWTTGTSLPGVVARSQAIVTKNYMYLLGGYNGSSYLSTTYRAPINSDGTLGTWATGTSLPAAVGDSQAVVTKNYVYLLGGSNGSSTVSTVYTAPINTDGTLGTWITGTSLPAAVGYSQAVVTKNYVYLLGGHNGNFVSTVYRVPFSGGLNDYSNYYNGTVDYFDPTSFRLPDPPSNISPPGVYSIIKT